FIDRDRGIITAAIGRDHNRAQRLEYLCLDLVVVGAGSVEVRPADDEAAPRECGQRRIELVAVRLRVDLYRAASSLAMVIENLDENPLAGAVALRREIRRPGDREAAIGETEQLGPYLQAGKILRDRNLGADCGAGRV